MKWREKFIRIGNLKETVRLPAYGKCYLEYLLESDYDPIVKEYWIRECILRYRETDEIRTKNTLVRGAF